MEIAIEVGTYIRLHGGEIRQIVGGTILLDDGSVTEPGNFSIPLENIIIGEPSTT